jgi:hypothetical protein
MGFTASHIFRQFVADELTHTATVNWGTDVPKVALYGNTGTPDENAAAANSAYNAGQWVSGNEVSQVGQWAAGGVALSTISGTTHFNDTNDAVWYTAANTQSGAAATLAGVFGDLVYDDTLTTPVAKQGMAFHYFGGSNSVTGGQFTVQWSANGILRFTV